MKEGFVFNDGGRAAAGYKGTTGDCVCRAIAIATGKPYQEVYFALSAMLKDSVGSAKNRRKTTTPRNGISMDIAREYLASLGWKWVPAMQIGHGCRVHLDAGELPAGRLIVRVSKHFTCMIDGVIYDNHDPRRYVKGIERRGAPSRCVYGYFVREGAE